MVGASGSNLVEKGVPDSASASPPEQPQQLLDIEAHRAHQRKSVAMGDYAGRKTIIEDHFPVCNAIVAGRIYALAAQVLFDVRQSKIMSRDDTDSAELDQFAHYRGSTDLPVVRVCSAQ